MRRAKLLPKVIWSDHILTTETSDLSRPFRLPESGGGGGGGGDAAEAEEEKEAEEEVEEAPPAVDVSVSKGCLSLCSFLYAINITSLSVVSDVWR